MIQRQVYFPQSKRIKANLRILKAVEKRKGFDIL